MACSEELFECIGQKLNSSKPSIRLNLLRIIGSISDATDDGAVLLDHFGLLGRIRELQFSDSAVLVRSMAQELVRACEEVDNMSMHSGNGVNGGSGGRRRLNGGVALRRTSATSTPPHLLERQMSFPSGPGSPQLGRSDRASVGAFDGSDGVGSGLPGRLVQTPRRQRHGIGYLGASAAMRPASRDSASGLARHHSPALPLPVPTLQRASTTTGHSQPSSSGFNHGMNDVGVAKSRLPRGTTNSGIRLPAHGTSYAKQTRDPDENTLTSNGAPNSLAMAGKDSWLGSRNGTTETSTAQARRTAARRQPSGDRKWS